MGNRAFPPSTVKSQPSKCIITLRILKSVGWKDRHLQAGKSKERTDSTILMHSSQAQK